MCPYRLAVQRDFALSALTVRQLLPARGPVSTGFVETIFMAGVSPLLMVESTGLVLLLLRPRLGPPGLAEPLSWTFAVRCLTVTSVALGVTTAEHASFLCGLLRLGGFDHCHGRFGPGAELQAKPLPMLVAASMSCSGFLQLEGSATLGPLLSNFVCKLAVFLSTLARLMLPKLFLGGACLPGYGLRHI